MKIQLRNNCNNKIFAIVNGQKYRLVSGQQVCIELENEHFNISLVSLDEKSRYNGKKNVSVFSNYEGTCSDSDILEVFRERYDHCKLDCSGFVYTRLVLANRNIVYNPISCLSVNNKELKKMNRKDSAFDWLFDFAIDGLPVVVFCDLFYALLCWAQVFTFKWWVIGCISLIIALSHFFIYTVIETIFDKIFDIFSFRSRMKKYTSSIYLIDYFSNTDRLCEVIEVDRDFDWFKSNK